MILLIIDTDPDWIAFLQATYPGATLDPTAPWTLAIVSARLMRDVPAEIWQRGAVVATNTLCGSEGIDAYGLGARLYFSRDFAPGKVKAILDGVTMPRPECVEGPEGER